MVLRQAASLDARTLSRQLSPAALATRASAVARVVAEWRVTICVGASSWILANKVLRRWHRARVYAERTQRTHLEHEADQRKLIRTSSNWNSWREQSKKERAEILRRVEMKLGSGVVSSVPVTVRVTGVDADIDARVQ